LEFRPTVVERAFELARTGEYATVKELRARLKVEGFAVQQIEGRSLGKQLTEICKAARPPLAPT
jgi:hypothetical protein